MSIQAKAVLVIRVVVAVQPSGFDCLRSLPLMAVFLQHDMGHWATQSNI